LRAGEKGTRAFFSDQKIGCMMNREKGSFPTHKDDGARGGGGGGKVPWVLMLLAPRGEKKGRFSRHNTSILRSTQDRSPKGGRSRKGGSDGAGARVKNGRNQQRNRFCWRKKRKESHAVRGRKSFRWGSTTEETCDSRGCDEETPVVCEGTKIAREERNNKVRVTSTSCKEDLRRK